MFYMKYITWLTWAQGRKSVLPATWKLRQENHKFEVRLDSLLSPCLKLKAGKRRG